MTEYKCPQCGEVLEQPDECQSCGWMPREQMSNEEIVEAVKSYLDDHGETSKPQDIYREIFPEEKKDVIAIIYRAKREWRLERKRTTNPPPAPSGAPAQGGMPNVPDWVLRPYEMQIEQLKEQLKDTREQNKEQATRLLTRITELEKELREEIKKPMKTDERFKNLEDAMMKRVEKDILEGKPGVAPRHWAEELMIGLVQSGQLGSIMGEVGGLLGDLRGRGNNPPPEWVAQQQQQPQQAGRVQAGNIPPVDIKRRQREMPPGVQPVQRPRPQAEPVMIDVEQATADMFPDDTQPQPEYQEQPQTPPPQEQFVPPQPEPEPPQPQFNTPLEEAKALGGEFLRQYPGIQKNLLRIAVLTTQKEFPQATFQQKLLIILRTILSLDNLQKITKLIDLEQIRNAPMPTVANYIISDREHLPDTILLAKYGVEYWFKNLTPFKNEPGIKEAVAVLEKPEVRQWVDEVVATIRPILQQQYPQEFV